MGLISKEYATFQILVDLKKGNVTSIGVTKDYELKNKNTQGPGIKYEYIDNSTGKPFMTTSDVNMHGIYQGPNNRQLPREGETYTKKYDNYDLDPIDETDANAKQHDLDYDGEDIRGFGGILSKRSSKANEDYIKRAEKTIEKHEKGEKDNVTGKKVTKETAKAAKFGKGAFQTAETLKKEVPEERKRQMENSGPKY